MEKDKQMKDKQISDDFKKEKNHMKIIKQKIGTHSFFLDKINEYYKKKTGYYLSDTLSIEFVTKLPNEEKAVLNKEKVEWFKLGPDLLTKLSNLLYPLTSDIEFYTDRLISIVESPYAPKTTKTKSNGNGHGLS
jgi:hypothetical protein